jgi:hypothetical protein
MSLPEIAFLTMVCAAFGSLAVTLGWAVWYCRERKPAKRIPHQAFGLAPALARSPPRR